VSLDEVDECVEVGHGLVRLDLEIVELVVELVDLVEIVVELVDLVELVEIVELELEL
jgi:hypothetical protein